MVQALERWGRAVVAWSGDSGAKLQHSMAGGGLWPGVKCFGFSFFLEL